MVKWDILSGSGLFEGLDKERTKTVEQACVCVCVFVQVLQLETLSKMTVKMINEGISGGKQ